MKLTLSWLTIVLSGCAFADQSNHLSVFGTNVTIDSSCVLYTEFDAITYKKDLPFEGTRNCRIVTHSNTSIAKTLFINGGYILFIENNHVNADPCYSEYTAIKVGKSGKVATAPNIKKSGSCFQTKDNMEFEYFSSRIGD